MYFLIILKGFPPQKKTQIPIHFRGPCSVAKWGSKDREEMRQKRRALQAMSWMESDFSFICGSISIYPTPILSPSRPHNLRPSRLRHNGLVSPVLSNLFNKTKKTIRIFRTNCFISCVASGRNKDDNSTRKVNTSSPIAY